MKKFFIGAGVVAAGVLMAGAPAQAAEKAEACAAYYYQNTDTLTLCDLFPGSKDRDCAEMERPVRMLKKGVDPWRLDRDGNGVGCEKGDAAPAGGKVTPTKASGGAETLPKTGPGMPLFVGGGVAAVAGAGALVLLARRRKVRFVA